jgi:hypothetical protein
MILMCPDCFSNNGLKRRLVEIRPDYNSGPCDYHPSKKGIPLSAIAAIVDPVFRNNYGLAEDEPYFSTDSDDDRVYFRQGGNDLRDTLQGLTGVDDVQAGPLIAQLIEDDDYWPQDGGEAFYDEQYGYSRLHGGDGGNGHLWQRFCQEVVHGRRFFSDSAKQALATIFEKIHLQRDVSKRYPVYLLEPGTAAGQQPFFRARIVNSEELKAIAADPVGRMGAAPPRSGRANRMNPSGIQAFYGSFEEETCLSELRPLVGDTVAIARFEIRRPLCILDTTRFETPPKELNIFARDHIRRLGQWRFMQRFMTEIARPISKDDEHLDYVPTQVVAEYLNREHFVHIGENRRHIDAIIYESAQNPPGQNIVFLGDAAMAERPSPSSGKGPTSPTSSFDLDLFAPPQPLNPGLKLADHPVMVVEIGRARFAYDGAQPLRDVLNPPF